MRKNLLFVLSFVAALTCAVTSFAQVTTATLSGKVSDAAGAVIGAPVVAVYTPTGTTYYSVSDKNGAYRINGANPGGPYTVTVEMLGYRKAVEKDVYAPLGENTVTDFVLEDEAISLDAAVFTADVSDAGMNIRRAGASTNVSQRTMENLPTSSSRSLNDVLKLTPQATTGGGGFSAGGGNYRSSYITVDGAAFNNAFGIGSNLPAGGSPISLDAIEQMTINITPYDVRQGGFTGAAVNSVTKSGTNELKVSVYDYYSSDRFVGLKYANAAGEVKELPASDALSNTVGFTIGGPVIKNKLFFFVNYETEPKTTPATNWLANDGTWDPANSSSPVHRPTAQQMNDIKSYLADKYDYNPGRFENFSVDIPVTKLLARVDWNINANHKFTVRYSQVERKTISLASDSVNPIGDGAANVGYVKKTGGRKTSYCLPFESAYYFSEDNFYSVAGELNSRFFDGKLNNVLRATYSHQNIPRSYYGGDKFPTVDILGETNGVLGVVTTIGPDPFTKGNLRDVITTVYTDEASWTSGIHNFIAGLQYEHNNTKNGFMQGGAGWYTFSSWDAFVNNELPASFCITHGNNDELSQVYPSFDYNQASAYFQDEMELSDRFKLTAGLRFELPMYPDIEGNENRNFTEIYKSYGGYKTSDMPGARVNVSPRIGFNWDIKGDRSLILRGGTGVYTGRIPFVWIVSVAGNSNCLQNQVIMHASDIAASTDGKVNGVTIPHFHTSVADITSEMYGGTFKRNENLAAPTGATVLDKDLRMPTTWKASLALDADLPWGMKGSLEAIYNKNFNSTVVHKLGYTTSNVTLPGEPESRTYYNAVKEVGAVHPYLITNPEKGVNEGYYASVTATLKKNFAWGLDLMAAYTYSAAKALSDGDGDQVTSLFDNNMYCKDGPNHDELGYSSFVSPNRVIVNANYALKEGRHMATNFGLFYEGYNYGMVGTYGASRFSYTTATDYTGIGGAANLMFIPTAEQLKAMPFADESNRAAFESYIAADRYLSKHRGEYAQRGGGVMPWFGQLSVKVSQDFMIDALGKTHTLRIGADINNIGNMINAKWGNVQQIASTGAITYDAKSGSYSFNQAQCRFDTYANTLSTWSILFSARYFF